MIYQNILQTIGNTPLVRINNFNLAEASSIYAKLEGFNPSGSIKDRIALKMIEHAENYGLLDKDKTIIEPSSGNTGIGLAMLGAVKGYKVIIVMSEAVSVERRKILRAYGAELILTPKDEGTDGAIRKVHELVANNPDKYYFPNQFSNQHNVKMHYKTTAEEIWKAMNGNIDFFVSSLGTSGTIMGVGEALKEHNNKIKIVEAHPVHGHYIQGLKNMEEAIVPEIYDPNKIDISILINTEDAYEMTREIIKKEALLVGMSSGAAMYAAVQIAREYRDSNIVVVFPDRAEKYLSTELFV